MEVKKIYTKKDDIFIIPFSKKINYNVLFFIKKLKKLFYKC